MLHIKIWDPVLYAKKSHCHSDWFNPTEKFPRIIFSKPRYTRHSMIKIKWNNFFLASAFVYLLTYTFSISDFSFVIGFLGKTLIDKLLRSCPDIENIYLLVRPKRGLDIHTRLEEIFDDQVFARLRATVPKFRHKIVAIAGDCSMPGLGIKIADHKTLTSNVDIVFHAAATVRFDEKLRLAVNINVHGTRELIGLCQNMKHLQVWFYCYCSHRSNQIGQEQKKIARKCFIHADE